MPFGVFSEHLQYFSHNSNIEFQNLLKPSQLKILLDTFSENRPLVDALEWGFDLWRSEAALKSIITSSSLGKIAGQLKNCKDLRFAYSQYLSSHCYSDTTSLLYRKSCIKELLIGLCICLEPAKEPESPFFPVEVGSGLFFDIDDDFYLKFPQTTGKYLFIFYANVKARFYVQEEVDDIEHAFKTLGYENGDFLSDQLNPAYRRIHS